MSNIVKANEVGGQLAAQLVDLASELGIDLGAQSALLHSESSAYTSFPVPEGVRTVVDAFKKDSIEWNLPGQGADFKEKFYIKIGDELVEFGPPHQIGGVVVGYSQRDHLAHYDGVSLKVECSVIGYTDPAQGMIKELPSIPYKNKYAWGSDKKLDRHTPDAMVEKLGLIGSRKMTCADCIKCGLSYKEVEIVGDDGKVETKTIECEPRGKLLIAVTELTKISKKKNPIKGQDPIEELNTKSIYDLYDEDGNPFTAPILVCLTMSKSFIRGAYKSGIIGYADYVKNLDRNHKEGPLKNPVFHHTTFRMVKGEGKSTIYQPHFASMGTPSTDTIRSAMASYQKPVRSAVSITLNALPEVREEAPNGFDYQAEESPF